MATERPTPADKSRKKLESLIKSEVTQMFENALDFAQVAVPPQNWNQLRSKILRVGNNCIRNLHSQLRHYDVQYKPQVEDFIEFGIKENVKR